MKMAGISLGPLRSLDTSAGSTDLSGGKSKKLLSGEHSSANIDVMTQIAWPHNCLDVVRIPNPPPYADLSIAEFAAGFVGKRVEVDHSSKRCPNKKQLQLFRTGGGQG